MSFSHGGSAADQFFASYMAIQNKMSMALELREPIERLSLQGE
jgi:hypothetical protein